jgi:hypothetical protein
MAGREFRAAGAAADSIGFDERVGSKFADKQLHWVKVTRALSEALQESNPENSMAWSTLRTIAEILPGDSGELAMELAMIPPPMGRIGRTFAEQTDPVNTLVFAPEHMSKLFGRAKSFLSQVFANPTRVRELRLIDPSIQEIGGSVQFSKFKQKEIESALKSFPEVPAAFKSFDEKVDFRGTTLDVINKQRGKPIPVEEIRMSGDSGTISQPMVTQKPVGRGEVRAYSAQVREGGPMVKNYAEMITTDLPSWERQLKFAQEQEDHARKSLIEAVADVEETLRLQATLGRPTVTRLKLVEDIERRAREVLANAQRIVSTRTARIQTTQAFMESLKERVPGMWQEIMDATEGRLRSARPTPRPTTGRSVAELSASRQEAEAIFAEAGLPALMNDTNDILDRVNRLGFDSLAEARDAIQRHADWEQRWDVSDLADADIETLRLFRLHLYGSSAGAGRGGAVGAVSASGTAESGMAFADDMIAANLTTLNADRAGGDEVRTFVESWLGGEGEARRWYNNVHASARIAIRNLVGRGSPMTAEEIVIFGERFPSGGPARISRERLNTALRGITRGLRQPPVHPTGAPIRGGAAESGIHTPPSAAGTQVWQEIMEDVGMDAWESAHLAELVPDIMAQTGEDAAQVVQRLSDAAQANRPGADELGEAWAERIRAEIGLSLPPEFTGPVTLPSSTASAREAFGGSVVPGNFSPNQAERAAQVNDLIGNRAFDDLDESTLQELFDAFDANPAMTRSDAERLIRAARARETGEVGRGAIEDLPLVDRQEWDRIVQIHEGRGRTLTVEEQDLFIASRRPGGPTFSLPPTAQDIRAMETLDAQQIDPNFIPEDETTAERIARLTRRVDNSSLGVADELIPDYTMFESEARVLRQLFDATGSPLAANIRRGPQGRFTGTQADFDDFRAELRDYVDNMQGTPQDPLSDLSPQDRARPGGVLRAIEAGEPPSVSMGAGDGGFSGTAPEGFQETRARRDEILSGQSPRDPTLDLPESSRFGDRSFFPEIESPNAADDILPIESIDSFEEALQFYGLEPNTDFPGISVTPRGANQQLTGNRASMIAMRRKLEEELREDLTELQGGQRDGIHAALTTFLNDTLNNLRDLLGR